MDNMNTVKRKITHGNVDVHPVEMALIVNYRVEAVIFDAEDNALLGEARDRKQTIKLQNFSKHSDISTTANTIISKFPLIDESKVSHVEQLLYYLQTRMNNVGEKMDNLNCVGEKSKLKELEMQNLCHIEETAHLNNIDEYIEFLYEDVSYKIKGTSLILQLARNPDNLEEIVGNEYLIGALIRVLKENYKSCIDITINISYTFFCFSTFSDFHHIIAQFKIGSFCLKILEELLPNFEKLMDEISKKSSAKKKLDSKRLEMKIKYENLFRVLFYLMINLAEDKITEKKIVNKNIIDMLIRSLINTNTELLILIISFLKKLSIVAENKNEMKRLNIVQKLLSIFLYDNQDLHEILLCFIFNLTFDKELRSLMKKYGYLRHIVPNIKNENLGPITTYILYNFSADDENRNMFTEPFLISHIMRKLIDKSQPNIVILALAINISQSEKCAKIICRGSGLKILMKRAFKFHNALLLKMVRNISNHKDLKVHFLDYLEDIVDFIIKKEVSEDFLIECVGIMANLNLPDIDYKLLVAEYNMVEWIKERLTPDAYPDDLLLEIIIVIGTICNEDGCAVLIAHGGIVQNLIQLLHVREDDDEIVCQIIYVLHQLIYHKSTRDEIIKNTDAANYMLDLMNDKNVNIRNLCSSTLAIIAQHDVTWTVRICKERFRWHNLQWLGMVEQDVDKSIFQGQINCSDLSSEASESMFQNMSMCKFF